jgi:hypothetical protein
MPTGQEATVCSAIPPAEKDTTTLHLTAVKPEIVMKVCRCMGGHTTEHLPIFQGNGLWKLAEKTIRAS